MIILQVDHVAPDELGFALTFLALVMVCVAVDKIISEFKKASREIKAAQWDLAHPAEPEPKTDDESWHRFVTAHECQACGGSGNDGKCKACAGSGVAA